MYNIVSKIEYKEFKRKFKGYDTEEVDEFLDDIADEINKICMEKRTVEGRVEELEERLEGMMGMEKTIQKTLVLAQNAANEAKITAEKEVAYMMSEANELAKKTMDEAVREKAKIENDLERLKLAFNTYRKRVVDFMSSQQEDFEDMAIQLERPHERESVDLSSKYSENEGFIRG